MTPVAAIAHAASLRVSRGPLLFALLLGGAALVFSLPPLDGLPPHAAVRQGTSYVLQATMIAAGAVAVLTGLARGAEDARSVAARVRGPRVAAAGELLGLLLVVAGFAGAAALAGYAWMTLAVVDPGKPTEEPAFRATLWRNDVPLALAPGESFAFEARPGPFALGAATLDLAPRLRSVRRAEGPASSRATTRGRAGAIGLRWRAAGRPWRADFVSPRRGRVVRAALAWSDEARPTDRLEAAIAAPPDAALYVAPGGATLLGARTPPAASLLRGALAVAAGAFAAGALVRLLRAFLGVPVAAAAALTLALAAASAGDLEGLPAWAARAATWIPGGGAFDPAEAARFGRAVEWTDVGGAALRALLPAALAVLCARRAPEPRP